MQVLAASLSATVFFALGGALGAHSWRMPFWLYVSAIFIAVPMVFVLWEPAKDARRAERAPTPWRQVAGPSSVTLFGGIVFYALIVQLPYVLTDLGVDDVAVIGAGTAAASAATAVGALSFRFLGGSGPARLLPVAFGLAGAGLLAIWASGSVPLALAGAMVTSAGTGLLLPTLLTWAVAGLTMEQRGRGTGIWTGSLYIGQFISPIILGAVAAGVGRMPIALGLLGVLAVIAAVIAVVARPRSGG